MNKSSRIAITGASGFLAGEIIRTLQREGYTNLVLLCRDSSRVQFSEFDIVEVQMNNPHELSDALKGVEVVFHTAAMVSFSDRDAAKIIETNVEITSHLVNAAKECGVKKIIHTSSIAALGGMKQGKMYIDENSLLEDFTNTSPYGKSKFLCENQIHRASAMGIDTVIVNPGVILGEGDSLTSQIKKGLNFYTLGVTGYVDVRDVAEAEVRLMTCGEAVGENFVLVSENLSFKALILMGAKRPLIKVTPFMFKIICPVLSLVGRITGREPLISRSSARAATTKSYYNGKKILKYIDFKYTPIKTTVSRALK